MKRTVPAFLLAAVLLASIPGGCGSQPAVQYSTSAKQPIIAYYQTQALPPEFAPHGPNLLIYGNGTAYQRSEAMDYVTGVVPPKEIEKLLGSIVGAGFFTMKSPQGKPKPGGITDNVTVTTKERSNGVQGADDAGGDFGAVVNMLKGFKVPKAQKYYPENVVIHAAAATEPFSGTVREWTASPVMLEQAAAKGAYAVSGGEAEQAWKLLEAARGEDEQVAWRADGKLYMQVYAVPQFPAPGV